MPKSIALQWGGCVNFGTETSIMKIGIIRETKSPPDRRVPFSPAQLAELQSRYPGLEFILQPGPIRCFTDREYEAAGIPLREDLSQCEVLFGVKEVAIDALIPGKTYVFFSHTAKKQPYNRKLLQEIVARRIRLVDYEYMTDPDGIRLVAFGRWAGIVGAYNGLRAYGERYRQYRLKPAHECHDLEEMRRELEAMKKEMADLPSIKILVTGGGRVASGAMETLGALKLETVPPEKFLREEYEVPLACRIDPWDYVRRADGKQFELVHFFRHPEMYRSTFKPYTKVTDVFIACHYWDPRSPVFMTRSDMREPDFHMRVIADVSCDIGGPIPSTVRASTIEKPFYGYDPLSESETAPFELQSITVMAVDNLPGELPRDASVDFGSMLMEKVVPALAGEDPEGIIGRATIAADGGLTAPFAYLEDFIGGK
jgi:saccharopine dehydrogenase (NAD+, L-lysine-forming)